MFFFKGVFQDCLQGGFFFFFQFGTNINLDLDVNRCGSNITPRTNGLTQKGLHATVDKMNR